MKSAVALCFLFSGASAKNDFTCRSPYHPELYTGVGCSPGDVDKHGFLLYQNLNDYDEDSYYAPSRTTLDWSSLRMSQLSNEYKRKTNSWKNEGICNAETCSNSVSWQEVVSFDCEQICEEGGQLTMWTDTNDIEMNGEYSLRSLNLNYITHVTGSNGLSISQHPELTVFEAPNLISYGPFGVYGFYRNPLLRVFYAPKLETFSTGQFGLSNTNPPQFLWAPLMSDDFIGTAKNPYVRYTNSVVTLSNCGDEFTNNFLRINAPMMLEKYKEVCSPRMLTEEQVREMYRQIKNCEEEP